MPQGSQSPQDFRSYADIYNWDEGLVSGPRAEMYEEIEVKRAQAGNDEQRGYPDEVRRHTPRLARKLLPLK
jgi:hypothetical protein